MSTVYLSSVQSASKLDSHTGLPVTDGESGATRSNTLLPKAPSPEARKKYPLSPQTLEACESPRQSPSGSKSSLGEAEEENEEEEGEEGEVKASSFGDILESRDTERDHAWMEMQVELHLPSST